MRTIVWTLWCAALLSGMIWARGRTHDATPPTRVEFEERHRVCYDIYAASDPGHAYDLLAQTFGGSELDRQYCLYAKASKQLARAGASVTVWDLQYQDFRLLESKADHCSVYSKWNVVYVLGHSKHSHVRSNAYEAVFEMQKDATGWHVISSRILSDNELA